MVDINGGENPHSQDCHGRRHTYWGVNPVFILTYTKFLSKGMSDVSVEHGLEVGVEVSLRKV